MGTMDNKTKTALLRKLGHKIKVKRVEQDLTQVELAEIIDCNPSHLGHIERGQTEPSFTMIIRIAKALLISPKDLMPE
jgi:DNA-binding XRE family transcriptional regulator